LAAARAGTPACTSMKCGVPVGRRMRSRHPRVAGLCGPRRTHRPPKGSRRARRRDRRAPPNRR
jgi:hypothetical protein